MSLSDTFYVALCMTVLILGAVYWFWTQNQFMLRKLSLLENIVYEMKMALSTAPSPAADAGAVSGSGLNNTSYAPAPGSVMSDDDAELLNDDLQGVLAPSEESSSAPFVPISQDSPVLQVSEQPSYAKPDEASEPVTDTVKSSADDLQPGGVGSGVPEVKTGESAYDSMKLTELRRLAESRGISGAKEMRKQALIDALRNAPTMGSFDLTDGVLELN